MHDDLGVVYVHGDPLDRGQYVAAHLARDPHGIGNEPLVRSLCHDLKALFACKELRNVGSDRSFDILHVLFAHGTAADADDTEHLADALEHSVDVGIVILRLDDQRALRTRDLKISVAFCAIAQIFTQDVLKIAAVCPLENDLPVFAE